MSSAIFGRSWSFVVAAAGRAGGAKAAALARRARSVRMALAAWWCTAVFCSRSAFKSSDSLPQLAAALKARVAYLRPVSAASPSTRVECFSNHLQF